MMTALLMLFRYGAVGKVASGHQASIICLSLLNTQDGKENLITGSKDHFIKLFDLSSSDQNCLVQPKFTLEPPHYDGVQCLAHRGTSLFSGSRDMCIKKWNLDDQSLVQVCRSTAVTLRRSAWASFNPQGHGLVLDIYYVYKFCLAL